MCETECQGRQQDHLGRGGSTAQRLLCGAVHAGSITRPWLYLHKGKISLCDLGVIYIHLWTFAAPVYIQPVSWLLQGCKQKWFTNLAEFFEHCGPVHEDYHAYRLRV